MDEQETAKPVWSPIKITDIQEKETTYDHGFSEEEVLNIKAKYKELEAKVVEGYEVTLDEFKSIVVPHCRIHRTEQFILNPVKVKEPKVPKEKKEKVIKEKVPKVKKLTQKQIKENTAKLQKIIMKKAANLSLTEDELEFLKTIDGEFA